MKEFLHASLSLTDNISKLGNREKNAVKEAINGLHKTIETQKAQGLKIPISSEKPFRLEEFRVVMEQIGIKVPSLPKLDNEHPSVNLNFQLQPIEGNNFIKNIIYSKGVANQFIKNFLEYKPSPIKSDPQNK